VTTNNNEVIVMVQHRALRQLLEMLDKARTPAVTAIAHTQPAGWSSYKVTIKLASHPTAS
jgi:hypothetical protein